MDPVRDQKVNQLRAMLNIPNTTPVYYCSDSSDSDEEQRSHNRAFKPKTEPTSELTAKDFCVNCNKIGKADLCGRCKKVRYCNAECQKSNWEVHKTYCSSEPPLNGKRNLIFENTLALTTLSKPEVYPIVSAVSLMITKMRDTNMITRAIDILDDGKSIIIKVYVMDIDSAKNAPVTLQYNRRVRKESGLEESEEMFPFTPDPKITNYRSVLKDYVKNYEEFNNGNEEIKLVY
jgi:hypothetical protein